MLFFFFCSVKFTSTVCTGVISIASSPPIRGFWEVKSLKYLVSLDNIRGIVIEINILDNADNDVTQHRQFFVVFK